MATTAPKSDTTAASLAALEALTAPIRERAGSRQDLEEQEARLRAEHERLAGKYSAVVEAHAGKLEDVRGAFGMYQWANLVHQGTEEGRREIAAERTAGSAIGSLRRMFQATPMELEQIAGHLASLDILEVGSGAGLAKAGQQLAEISRRLALVPEVAAQLEESMALLTKAYPNARKRPPSGYKTDGQAPPQKPPRALGVTEGFESRGGGTRP